MDCFGLEDNTQYFEVPRYSHDLCDLFVENGTYELALIVLGKLRLQSLKNAPQNDNHSMNS